MDRFKIPRVEAKARPLGIAQQMRVPDPKIDALNLYTGIPQLAPLSLPPADTVVPYAPAVIKSTMSGYEIPLSKNYEIVDVDMPWGDRYQLARYKVNNKDFIMHPEAWDALQKARADIKTQYKWDIMDNINEMFRTIADQEDLIRRFEAGEPGIYRPARPGSSYHHYGLAIDIDAAKAKQVADIMKKYGFGWGQYHKRPDPVHFEYIPLMSKYKPIQTKAKSWRGQKSK